MGKGVIVEHLGDAHYRIGLDIDVTYARNALYGLQTYLAEFAPKYQEATEKKDAAKEALTPINDRLTEYLKAGQEASQAAYEAMIEAYDAYADAVQSLPDQEMVQAAQDAADEVSGEFAGNPNDETAIDTLAADSLWQSLVGDFLDPAAVQAATDAKNAAISDLVTAQQEFDIGNIPEEALTFFQQNYDTLRGDWLTIVTENSGPSRVQTLEGQWQDATAAFDTARQELGKLLENGGMPEALAKIVADQEKAYADYHAALANWADMLMVKTEKEKLAAELQSRLIAYTDNDGNPIRQEVNAWCCDYTEDLTEGAEVATIEIPGERDLAVRVRPGYESRENYQAERDGILQPSWAGSPEQTYWNWALHPGNARWHPNYRLGEILLIDAQAGTCTVQLDQQTNSERSRARDGTVLDVNNPIKYQIDPDTGEQTVILPGDNVQVDDGITTLTDVPIEYMECNALAFIVGDRVMVEFQGRDWTQAKVIGFAENPRPCSTRGLILAGNAPVQEFLVIPDHVSQIKIRHGTGQGANIEWLSTDGKTCLTWAGPRGRSLAPRMPNGPYPYFYVPADFQAWDDNINAIRASNLHTCVMATRFGVDIYRNGKLAGTAPTDWIVLGAASITHVDGQGGRHVYLVAALGSPRVAVPGSDDQIDLEAHPEFVRHRLVYAKVTGSQAIGATGWTLMREDNLSSDPDILPPINCYFFSASGLKFASLIPTVQTTDTTTPGGTAYQRTNVGNDAIIRGELLADANGVTVSAWSLTKQADNDGLETLDQSTTVQGDGLAFGGTGYGPWESTYENTMTQSSSAIVAIDFVGEEEATLSASLTRSYDATGSGAGVSAEAMPEVEYEASSLIVTESQIWQLTDDYRNVTVGSWTYSRSASTESGFTFAAGYASSETNTATSSGTLQYPLWYDLRHGGAVYESGSGNNTYQRTLSGLLDGTTNAGAISGSDTTGISLSIQANDPSPVYTYLKEHTKILDAATSAPIPTYGAPRQNSSTSISIDTPPDSVCNQVRPFGWKVAEPWRMLSIPLVYADRMNDVGGIVCRILQDRYLGLNGYFDVADIVDEGDVNIPTRINIAFSNVSDLDAAWQAHLNEYHPPAESEEPPTSTAAEADLTPLYRV